MGCLENISKRFQNSFNDNWTNCLGSSDDIRECGGYYRVVMEEVTKLVKGGGNGDGEVESISVTREPF